MGLLGEVDSTFTYKLLIMAVAMLVLVPMFVSLLVPQSDISDSIIDDLESDYSKMTGSAPVSEEVWALTGIYTPYTSGASYSYTEDGWLYASRIGGTYAGDSPSNADRLTESATAYAPSQYNTNSTKASYYSVAYDGTVYKYTGSDSSGTAISGETQDGHSRGDTYTMVTMDVGQKSSIFFSEGLKTTNANGQFFYQYEGYRYAFSPLEDTVTVNADGEQVTVSSQQTTLSLIWYSYYGNEGISGQLVLNASNGGVAYLTAAQIISAYDSTNNTAKFVMTFNGVDMNVYIRINPVYTSAGYSIEDCFYNGFWSVMITSLTTDANDYLATDYSLNATNIWDTFVNLMTFDTSSYGFSGWLGTIASLMMVIPLYLGLIVVGMNYLPVMVFTAILGAVQTLATAMKHWSFW